VESAALVLKQRYQRVEAQSSPNEIPDLPAARIFLMADDPDISHPPDICLILRVHGEQRWLISEVVSLVRQLEQPGMISEDQVGAALAYLEVLWLDACQRAAETDAARAQLDRESAVADHALYDKARRYHAAVRRLRDAVGRRVAALTARPGLAPADWSMPDRYVSS